MIKLKDILNEGSNNPANIKAYYEALCKSEKITPLPVKFNNIDLACSVITLWGTTIARDHGVLTSSTLIGAKV